MAKTSRDKGLSIDSVCNTKKRSWRDGLTAEQKAFVEQVKARVLAEDLPKLTVARNLIEELELKVKPKQVADWFRGN